MAVHQQRRRERVARQVDYRTEGCFMPIVSFLGEMQIRQLPINNIPLLGVFDYPPET